MPDSAVANRPRRYWSYTETVAWVAFRDLNAVRAATQCDRLERDGVVRSAIGHLIAKAATGARSVASPAATGLTALSGSAVILNKSGVDELPGVRVRTAMSEVDKWVETGAIIGNVKGEFRVDVVKALSPSAEGRGKGQAKRATADYSKIARLGFYFIENAPGTGKPKPPLLKWCQKEGVANHWRDLAKVSEQALRWARRELRIRKRYGLGIKQATTPSPEIEFERYSANLDSWRQIWPFVHSFGDDGE